MTNQQTTSVLTTLITNLLKAEGRLDDFLAWQSWTPDWREQISAHHCGIGRRQGPEELKHLFRRVRNGITAGVSAWPTLPVSKRDQRMGRHWVTKAEWTATPRKQRSGRCSKDPYSSKACVIEDGVSLPVYVVDVRGLAY
jgi:hypothetical protein